MGRTFRQRGMVSMKSAEQGDLLKIGGIKYPVIVVSNDFFNQSGKVIVCPIVSRVQEGPLHIPLKNTSVSGYVLCEQVHYVDLSSRHFSKLTASHYFDVMDISDAVMSVFDYQQ